MSTLEFSVAGRRSRRLKSVVADQEKRHVISPTPCNAFLRNLLIRVSEQCRVCSCQVSLIVAKSGISQGFGEIFATFWQANATPTSFG